MSVTNTFSPFSESALGVPIIITTTGTPATIPLTDPGTLVHTSTELDSLWVWASLNEPISYFDSVYLRVLKGDNINGFLEDNLVRLNSGEKNLIESGVIITGSTQYRLYIDNEISTITPTISITGYVHRRVY